MKENKEKAERDEPLFDENIIEDISTEMATKSKEDHDAYRAKYFVTEDQKAIDKLLSEKFPYSIDLGIHTSKDMIWDLPTTNNTEISRQVVYSPKVNKFLYILMRFTDELNEEDEDTELITVNNDMDLKAVERLIVQRGNVRKSG